MLKLLRCKQVCEARGCGKSAHYADIKRGLYTNPVKVGLRVSAWPAHEVEAINRARVAGKNDAEVRQIVRRLMAMRRDLFDPTLLNFPDDSAGWPPSNTTGAENDS